MLLTSAIIATTSLSLLTAEPTPCNQKNNDRLLSKSHRWFFLKAKNFRYTLVHTTPAAPAVTAIGAVTELNPDEHITGMLTALEMEYAAASVGVACQLLLNFVNPVQWRNSLI